MEPMTVGIVGLGLIGGSLAKALRRSYPSFTILAADPHEEYLQAASDEGVINAAFTDADPAFAACDLLFLCTPVTAAASCLSALSPYLKPDCILTDVGSTKVQIARIVRELGLSSRFVGGHPMAGSERSGYPAARARLFENAWYVLTPDPEAPERITETLRELLIGIDALPIIIDPQKHDRITAAVSHLPHLIAAALADQVRERDDDGLMRRIAAGGFKDITRIAASSPVMWAQICEANAPEITAALDDYIGRLREIRRAVDEGDSQAVYDLFERAGAYRTALPDAAAGPIKKRYAITCDVPDESGAIATVATILASHGISIKNIGILHSRLDGEGALSIEFYEDGDRAVAADLLTRHQYLVKSR